jgi:hypothetical protein
MICIYANALIGFLMFEWAYSKVSRIREMHSKYAHIDKHFPHYRREDAKNWSRMKFWPGAVTILLPRGLLFGITIVFLYLGTAMALCCHREGAPIQGARFGCIKVLFNFWLRLMGVLGMWTWFSHEYI